MGLTKPVLNNVYMAQKPPASGESCCCLVQVGNRVGLNLKRASGARMQLHGSGPHVAAHRV